jgi:hypothetical protein
LPQDWLTTLLPQDWLILIGWGTGVLVLAAAAALQRIRSKDGFDIAVASEVIVVYGIASLVLSIVYALFQVGPIWDQQSGPSVHDLKPVLFTFGKGLVAAGVSPLAAVVLRLFDAFPPAGGAGSATGLAAQALINALNRAKSSTSDFADAMDAARNNAIALPAALQRAATGVGKAATDIASASVSTSSGLNSMGAETQAAARVVAGAAAEIGKLGPEAREVAKLLEGLRTAGPAAGPAVQALVSVLNNAKTAMSDFADAMDAARNNATALPAALQGAATGVGKAAADITSASVNASSGLKSMGIEAHAAGRVVADAASEIGKLGPEAKDVAELLDGLRTLISQIDHFIRDHGGRVSA